MHTELTDSTPAMRAIGPRWIWWLAIASPLLALLVTQPWHASAFPVWDFAEMLPILRGAEGPVDAFSRLAAFTRSDGRANYLTYLQIVGTWAIVGEDALGWQWQRALLMLSLGTAFVITVRRLGGTPFAAASGALMLVLAVPGTEGWLLLSGEPLAAILLLAVVILGRSAPTPATLTLLLLATFGTMLAKEVVGVLLPTALLVAICWDPRRGLDWRWPRRTLGWLTAGLGAVLVVEAGSVIAAIRDARPDAYATQFQPGVDRLTRVPQLFEAMLLPVRYLSSTSAGLLYPANAAFLLLLLGGGIVWWRQRAPSERRGGAFLALLLLSLPVIGAITYAFWPRYSAFYGIPFALGGAGLLSLALTQLKQRGWNGRVATAGATVVVLLFTAFASARTVAERQAFANLALVAVQQLGRMPEVDTVLVVKAGPGRNRWPITGPELARYAAAMRIDPSGIPVMLDSSCPDVAARLRAPLGRLAILNDQNACGSLPAVSHRFQAAADYFDWLSLAQRPDTLRLELLAVP